MNDLLKGKLQMTVYTVLHHSMIPVLHLLDGRSSWKSLFTTIRCICYRYVNERYRICRRACCSSSSDSQYLLLQTKNENSWLNSWKRQNWHVYQDCIWYVKCIDPHVDTERYYIWMAAAAATESWCDKEITTREAAAGGGMFKTQRSELMATGRIDLVIS